MRRYKRTIQVLIIAAILIFNSVYADTAKRGTPGHLETDNVAPTVDSSISKKGEIDLIFVTDNSGADMTSINSLINSVKIAVSGKNNVNSHFIGVDGVTKNPQNVLIGKQSNSVQMYNYSRLFKVNYIKNGYEDSPPNPRVTWYNTPDVYTLAYETVQLYAGQPLPPFQFSNNWTFSTKQIGGNYQGTGWGYIYDDYEVYDPNNIAATKKAIQFTTTMTMYTGYYKYMSYSITSKALDNKWTLTGINTQNQVNDYQAVNLDTINSLNLKGDSDKYIIFLSKGDSTAAYKGWGNYYSFGSMKNSNIGKFVADNNPNIYTVVPTAALDIKLNQQTDKLDRTPGQELSINELLSKTSGEVQHYGSNNLSTAIEHIKAKYCTGIANKIDIKIATDYSGTKLASFNTELASLKSTLASSGTNLNYELFTDKAINTTKVLKNKKIEAYYGHRLVLREDGTLYYYKNAIDSNQRNSAIDPQMIFQQYPYASGKITPQVETYYSNGSARTYYTMGNSFRERPIPPVKISENVSDAAFINGAIFYVKNGILYEIMNVGNYYTDSYKHQAVTNGTDISRIIYAYATLYAIKNDGSLWAISDNHMMYAHGRYDDYNNWPIEIKNGLSSFTLYRVGNGSLNSVKFKDIAMAADFAVGLTTTGEVYGWGNNTFGQLGDGQKGTFSGNTMEPLDYRYPVKSYATNIVSIGVYQKGTYYVNNNGVAYFSGLAGYTYEQNDPATPAPLPTSNPQPLPYYFNQANMQKHKYLNYNYETSSYYYQVYNYSPSPSVLYADGFLEIAIGVNPIKYKNFASYSVFKLSGALTYNIDTFKSEITSRYSYEANLWTSLPEAERQKKINDFNTSYNVLFNPTNKDYSMYTFNSRVDPIYYVVLDSEGNLKDNTVISSTEVYNNNYALTINNSKLLDLYNVDGTYLNSILNAPITVNYMSLDLSGIPSSSLQSQSDRYFLYASDTFGAVDANNTNYFSLLNLQDSFINYLNTNNIKAYAVTPKANINETNIVKLLNNKTGIYNNVTAFIKGLQSKYMSFASGSTLYLILNEDEIFYQSAYSDYENDSRNREEYFYEHDETYFENDQGKMSNTGVWTTTPIIKFTHKGKYTIKYKAQDKPSPLAGFIGYYKWSNESICTAYVHERPNALNNIAITPNGSFYRIVATDGGSYDNDHLSRADKGIAAHEWRWRESTETDWRYEQIDISNAAANKVYIIEHRVRDLEGAWSSWTTSTVDNTKPPVAQFTIANINNTLTTAEKLKVKDTSYAYFSTLTRWQWIIVNRSNSSVISNGQFANSNTGTGSMLGYDTNVKTDYADVGPGSYRVYLRVKSSNGLWSDGGTDAANGYVLANCYYQDITVKEALKIESVTIEGFWNHWRGQKDMFGKQLTNEPHRFLSLESVKINIRTSGFADKVVIRFSPQLEAMQFTDPYGNVYDYKDKTGYYVRFPQDTTINIDSSLDNNHVYWEYILPLAPSTKSWDDQRIRPSYSMTVTVWKGTNSVSQTINDIEITGNTYDLIYMQPAD